jgi:hypothetical protein
MATVAILFDDHIGMVEMEFRETFEVDSHETLRLYATLMHEFFLK